MPSVARLVTFALAFSCLAAPATAQGTSFFDDFDTLDGQRWYVSDGWANGDHQNCIWSAGQVKTLRGMLWVGFAPSSSAGGRDYACGEIQTRTAFGYGTFEARLKTPIGSGLNAAFFTYIGPQQGKPHDEVDFEVLLKDIGHVETTSFVNGVSGDGEVGSGMSHQLPYGSNNFVNFAVTWTPGRLDYYINNQLVRTMTESDQVPNNAMRIFFSLWGSDTLTDWMGTFAPPSGPLAMHVDWVAFTAQGEGCAFPDSVLCALR